MKKLIGILSSLLIMFICTSQINAADQGNTLRSSVKDRYRNQKKSDPVKPQNNPELLFIQTAEEAIITADPRAQDQYILTLRNVKPHIAYFSDKPKRVAGKVSIETFLARWNDEGEHSFKNNSPHASFVSSKSQINNASQKAGDLVSLSRPKYNPRTQTLTYIIRPQSLHSEIKEGKHQNPVLFIDEMNWPGFF